MHANVLNRVAGEKSPAHVERSETDHHRDQPQPVIKRPRCDSSVAQQHELRPRHRPPSAQQRTHWQDEGVR